MKYEGWWFFLKTFELASGYSLVDYKLALSMDGMWFIFILIGEERRCAQHSTAMFKPRKFIHNPFALMQTILFE